MANNVRLQVLVTDELVKELNRLRKNKDMSTYLREVLITHTAKACTKCGH